MGCAVYRDDRGIPHLWADSVDQLAYLQGRVAATDRAWQIEVDRSRCEGRLAEQLGPGELAWDRFARRARLADTARRCFQRLRPATQRWLAAYVDGVNDALPAAATQAPEFTTTGSSAEGCVPGRWQPWSPLGVFLVRHLLFGTFPHKLWRAHVTATLGPAAVDLFATEGPAGAGSNAWIVPAGADNPAPVIAGDPHRVIELPNVYQQVRLACPEFDVVGLAFPGVPGVPHFGHAGPVAWAITNAMADYQDLYREQLRRTGDGVLVREAGGWAPLPVHIEQIRVRGHGTEPVEVIETPRGPIIDYDRRTGEGISLRTPTRAETALGFDALLPLLRARTVDDVAAALRGWVEPVNSVLVAEASGRMRRLVAGLVPVRDNRCCRTPVPGWEPAFQWRPGYAPLPAADLTDVAVNANDRRPGDVAELGTDFAAPFRASRIRQLLADGAAPERIHTDVQGGSTVLHDLLARLDLSGASVPVQQLRRRLSTWDRRMHADSVDAGSFAAWRAALARRLYENPSLGPLRTESGFDELFTPWTDPMIRIGLALDPLVAGVRRLGVDVEPIAVAALAEVGANARTTAWGDRHVLHPIRSSPELTDLELTDPAVTDPAVTDPAVTGSVAVRLSGDTNCVLATASVPGVTDTCSRGPVARYVWDLTDRERSRWIVPFGASGGPDDPHFRDQLPQWSAGELIPVVTDWQLLTRYPEEATAAVVYQEKVDTLGTLSLHPVDPAGDAELLHGWVTERRARFWGMGEYSVDQVQEVYAFLDRLPTHHAYLIRIDGTPVGLFQTYLPAADPVGERYPVQVGDIGLHLLLAPGSRPPRGFTDAVAPALLRFLFSDPITRRVVVEPDVRNFLALRRAEQLGFRLAEEIELPEKHARLAFLTRSQFESGTREETRRTDEDRRPGDRP